MPIDASEEFYFWPAVDEGRGILLWNRDAAHAPYYADRWLELSGRSMDSRPGQPTLSDINAAISDYFPPDERKLWEEPYDGFPWLGGYNPDFIPIIKLTDSLDDYRPLEVLAAMIGGFKIWTMYRLALFDTVKRLSHFGLRGRPRLERR